jgi:hypothetical protein
MAKMFPEISEGNPPTSLATIEDFERKHVLLPGLYKEFLLAANGGRPTSSIFPITGMALNPDGSIQFFFGIGNQRWPGYDLTNVLQELGDRIPSGIIPIATTDTGEYLCLDLREGGERVVFWDRVHFWGMGEWRESDLYHVADSFEEFLASLRPDDLLGPPE